MVSGLIMLGAIVTHASPVTLREVTPIARLTGEYEVIVVPAASPFRSLQRSRSGRSGNGPSRSRGEADRRAAATRCWPGSSPTPSACRHGASTTSRSPAAAKRCLRFSADRCRRASTAWRSSPRRSKRAPCACSASRAPSGCPAWTAPTLREQGVDVEFENWRSLVAPPGISPVDRAASREGRSRPWCGRPNGAKRSQRYRWIDRYLAGDEFDPLRSTPKTSACARS